MSGNLWFYCALAASICWGLCYAITDVLLKKGGLPPVFLMLVRTSIILPFWIMLIAYTGEFDKGWNLMAQSPKYTALIILETFLVMGGVFLITYAISLKNATTVNIIEITYPLFTALFAYFIFKESQVNMWTAIGGLMIFSGVAVIYLKA